MELEISSVKGEKTDGKIASSGPLFPRLHVNDTKKIGTRAPPRNKMALYDQQLSISSQKPSNPPSSTLVPFPANGCLLTQALSSSHGVGSEKSMFSPYKNSNISVHSNGKEASCRSNEGILSDKINGNSVQISRISHRNETVNVAECPLPKLQLQPFEPCNLSQFKWPTPQKDVSEQPRVPTFVHPRMSLDSHKDRHLVGPNCTLELKTTTAMNVESLVSTDVEDHELKKRQDKNATPTSRAIDSISQKMPLEPLTEKEKEKENSGVSDQMPVTKDNQNRSGELDEADIIKAQDDVDVSKHGKEVCRGDATDENPKMSVVSNGSLLRSESCHESVITDAIENPITTEENAHHLEEKDRSNSSVKDCASLVILSPEVVVKMIGQEEFQKARNTMIQQQTTFAKQVFELHRLIKVQKMMTGSENILHKQHLPFGKDLIPPCISEAPSWNNRSRNGVPRNKLTADNPIEKPPLFPLNADTASIATNSAHNLSKSANTNMPMWCLSPPGNQWLLPVISPSEGLIYKPCYPNHPPPEGFLGTLYNEGGPTNTTTLSEEYPLGVSGASPVGPMYLTPYGMPILNPFASTPSLKQMTSYNNFNAVYPSSCNVGEAKDGVKLESIARYPKKVRTSYDALPLFPTAPTALDFGQTIQSFSNEKNAQVIKVIPHNPRLASESAARIFKLIQEERKHYCN